MKSSPLVRVVQSGRWLLMVLYLLVIVGLTLAWRDPVLRQYMEPAALARSGQSLLAMPLGPIMVLGAYVLAVVLAVPVAVLITVGALVFGPWPGMAYALVGMVSGAIVTYGVGLYLGAQLVDRWSTQGRIHALASALKRRGLWAIIIIRAVPVAPFVVVNMTAGAFRVRFRDYVLGSFIGLAPGTIMISLFMDRLTAALTEPDAITYGLLVAMLLLFGGVLWWFKRLMARGQASH